MTGVVLRYGQLYGPGTYFDRDGDFARQARRRMLPIVGSGSGVFSFVHVDDAAGAAVVALEHGDGVYNIVDDDPAAARDWIPAFCRDVGAPAPMYVPGWLVSLLAGRFAAATLREGRGSPMRRRKGSGLGAAAYHLAGPLRGEELATPLGSNAGSNRTPYWHC